tara:strand:- start:1095 stop:1379 length:285 start_codon:yes stop_codon:yes gene_type:complete
MGLTDPMRFASVFPLNHTTNPDGETSMIIFTYPSKKVLKENIGNPLNYIETSMFGAEYVSEGVLVGANRPHITGIGREFFAQVTMKNGKIAKVK